MSRHTVLGRLSRNLSASLLAKASVSIYRVAIVPLLIWFLGAERYGEWLLLSAVPSWLSLSNCSIGSVAANAMTLHAAEGNYHESRRVFSTTLVSLALFAAAGLVVACMLVWLVWAEVVVLPGQTPAAAHATAVAIAVLCGSVFVGFFAEPFAARLRAAGRADVGIAAGGTMPWIEAGCCLAALAVKADFVSLAVATFVSRCLFVALNWLISRSAHPELYFSWPDVRASLILPLLSKGLAYQALPLGHALSNQAMLWVVGAAIGPLAVAVFGTARTMVRLGTQAMELINFAVWPELSLLLGARNHRQAAALHRAAAAFTIGAGLATAIGVTVAGPAVFGFWTLHELSVTHGLMAIFGISMMLQSLWHASLIVQLAANEHEGVAVRYVLAALLAVLLCYPLGRLWGNYGAACSTLIIDSILIPYSITKALKITHDTLPEFAGGLLPAARAAVAHMRSSIVAG
jgi:O-antigen/teichoic acid export membrane protein